MAFISSSEGKIFIFHDGQSHELNIHSFHFTSEMEAIFNKNMSRTCTTKLTKRGIFHCRQANSHF